MYLRSNGASVNVTDDAERRSFRLAHGIPDAAASCHTALMEGYSVEGHVPVEALVRLLSERPDLVGLALPGMPSDSPGMGGDPASWAAQPVVAVDADGALTPYGY